ncbi:MAG: cation:proton antiporter [Microbacteriaceae bacterium]|nr:cation:proton antiporter [Microbacteriaceae bacterium]MCL2794278.1 cation:proton antiporter [Microbacteriaceae bacterium]
MTFQELALITAIALFGPLLAWSDRLRIPVVIGELAAGVVVGQTGLHWLDPHQPEFVFLANLGFALVMFVAGSHVPVRSPALRTGSASALLRLLVVVAAAAVLGFGVAELFGTGHAALYTVLFASSSAAVILPIVAGLGLSGPPLLAMLPQVAIADALCIVALPLALDPAHAGRAAISAALVIVASAVVFVLFWTAEKRGWRRAAHRKSERREFALELRVSLLALLLLAALAMEAKVSIMLAGFCLGLAVAAIGEPRRLARQLFALSDGVFGPVFFVWLGTSLNLRDLAVHPLMIVLGVVLAAAAVLAHAAGGFTRQPLPFAVLASAQLGVPVAAATLGEQLGVLKPGEGAALLLGALLTIAASTVSGRIAARKWSTPSAPAAPTAPVAPAPAPS